MGKKIQWSVCILSCLIIGAALHGCSHAMHNPSSKTELKSRSIDQYGTAYSPNKPGDEYDTDSYPYRDRFKDEDF